MNRYTCMHCGRIVVIRETLPELTIRCNCSEKPQLHKVGKQEVKNPAPQGVVAETLEAPLSGKPLPALPNAPIITNARAAATIPPVVKTA